MKRNFGWIISNDTTRIYNDAIGSSAFPVVTPPGNIILRRIFFSYIDLSPAGNSLVPGTGYGLVDRFCHLPNSLFTAIDGRCRKICGTHDQRGPGGVLQKGAAADVLLVHRHASFMIRQFKDKRIWYSNQVLFRIKRLKLF